MTTRLRAPFMRLRTKVFAWVLLTMGFVFALLTVNLLLEEKRREDAHQADLAQFVRVMTQDLVSGLTPFTTREDQLQELEQRLNRIDIFRDWHLFDSGANQKRKGGGQPADMAQATVEKDSHFVQASQHDQSTLTDGVFWTRIEYAPEDTLEPAPIGPGRYLVLRTLIKQGPATADTVWDSFQKVLLLMLLGTGLLTLTMTIVLERLVVKPLETLARASERLSLGDYGSPVPDPGTQDEIGDLLRTFNFMQQRLKEYHETLEARVAEATNKVKGAERRLIVAQRLSATGTLAAGIAHEINNPLGGMLNAARALKREGLAAPKREQYLDLIIESLLRIQDTVKKVLQFSPRKVNPQAASLREILDRAIGLAQYKLDKKRVKLTHEAPDRLPNVFCDPSELVQIFLNLILNAIDATEGEKGHIRVHYQGIEGEVATCVTDNGCGMTESELAQAFDLFYTTKGAEGTGLGLSVVYNIVQNHGGRIDVTSQKSVGTTFTVTLPVHREDQLAPPPAIPTEAAEKSQRA
ncbi:MAG: two-component system NtrC family sensor [Planctomycetota bacterium]|nr:MAG: two-component system NtrC family sensor [Planctomycetota bacterium]